MKKHKNRAEEGEISDDEWGDDLMGGMDDRQKLAGMTEIEREQIMYERLKKKQQRIERQEAVDRLQSEGKRGGVTRSDTARLLEESDDDDDDELAMPPTHRESEPSRGVRDEDSDNDQKKDDNFDLSAEESESDGEDVPLAQQHGVQDDNRQRRRGTQNQRNRLTLRVLKTAQVRRDALERCYHEPWMPKFVFGLFVKLCLGERNGTAHYKICEIAGVQPYHRTIFIWQRWENY
eukprot:UN31685